MAKQDLIEICVKPRSSRAGVEMDANGTLVVRVHAPATEGAANRECRVSLAKALGVPKSAVQIARGQKSRLKQVSVEGLSSAEVRDRLAHTISEEMPS